VARFAALMIAWPSATARSACWSRARRARALRVVARASRCAPLNAAGQTSVGQLVALLSLCDGFAGNDSGAMHVAGALASDCRHLRLDQPAAHRAARARAQALYHRIECSPCMDRTCRFGHYDCLKQVSVDEVETALVELGALR